ncbi:MAG: hypothetical protein Q9169_007769 [Polycauliona sp. 2 TL-2023]
MKFERPAYEEGKAAPRSAPGCKPVSTVNRPAAASTKTPVVPQGGEFAPYLGDVVMSGGLAVEDGKVEEFLRETGLNFDDGDIVQDGDTLKPFALIKQNTSQALGNLGTDWEEWTKEWRLE